jgi:hypothetical protein
MIARRQLRFAVAALASIPLLGPFADPTFASTVPFRTSFGADTTGLPPGTGGAGQPTGVHLAAGATVLVADELLGLTSKVADLDSPDGGATWLQWNVAPAVSDLGVSIQFSVSFETAYSGVFFDLNGTSSVIGRLRTTAAGNLQLGDGCAIHTLDSYTPGFPVTVLVHFAPPDSLWAIVDTEGDGFDDDVPVQTTSCNPGNLTGLFAYAWATVAGPARVAFDELVVDWLPLFVDDFETEDTARWSLTAP